MARYEIVEEGGAANSALAAGATELITAGPSRVPYFNFLLVQNFDTAVDSHVLLDSGVDATLALQLGKLIKAGFNKGQILIEPEDGIQFRTVANHNPSGVAAQTASAITFLWAYKKRIG